LVLHVVRVIGLNNMGQCGLSHNYCLYDYVFNLRLQFGYIVPLDLKLMPQAGQRSFVCLAIHLLAIIAVMFFILNKLVTELVDSVVRQMHEHVSCVDVVWLDVVFCSQSYKTFLVQKNPQRCNTIEQYVDS